MQVLDEKSASGGELAFVRKRPIRAVTLAGAFVGLLSLVPLGIAPGIEPLRLLSFGVLFTASVALVVLGRSRPERLVVGQKPGVLVWGGQSLPLPEAIALRGDATEEPPAYRAVVVWSDGQERVALEGSEPGPMLKDALALGRRLGLGVRPAWGLEHSFSTNDFAEEWERASSDASGSALTRTPPVNLPLWPVQRKVAGICIASGVFVPLVTAVLARSPERSATPSDLELWLTGLSAAFALLLGTYFAGIRRRVELSASGIQTTPVFFGSVVGRTELGPVATSAFAVTPNGGFARHVVFATPGGPISLPADADGAERLAARALVSPLPERTAPELPLVTSARYRGPDRPARLRS